MQERTEYETRGLNLRAPREPLLFLMTAPPHNPANHRDIRQCPLVLEPSLIRERPLQDLPWPNKSRRAACGRWRTAAQVSEPLGNRRWPGHNPDPNIRCERKPGWRSRLDQRDEYDAQGDSVRFEGYLVIELEGYGDAASFRRSRVCVRTRSWFT
jgi:hypothetical protein